MSAVGSLARMVAGSADPTDGPALLAALERARVVAVLDGWAQYRGPAGRGGQWYVVQDTVCVLHVLPHGAESELPPHYFDGETPDAARAAAARAIEEGSV